MIAEKHLAIGLEIAVDAVQEVGAMLRPHHGNIAADSKTGEGTVADVFTYLDRAAEDILEQKLGRLALVANKAIGFRGEERGIRTPGETTWLVDPIDGTSHFIRGMGLCTVMAALIDEGEVMLSAIHDIATGTTYSAMRGGGAYVDGRRLAVSHKGLKGAMVSTETRLHDPECLAVFNRIGATANHIMTLNSGWEFCQIAAGKIEGKIGLNPYGKDWDFAPGSLLVTEAGGVAHNIGTNAPYDYTNHNFIIGTPELYEDLTTGPQAIFPITD